MLLVSCWLLNPRNLHMQVLLPACVSDFCCNCCRLSCFLYLLCCLSPAAQTNKPQWVAFNEAYTAWAVSMGAIPSLSQTKGLKPGQVTLPKALTRERFLTPYYKSFVV